MTPPPCKWASCTSSCMFVVFFSVIFKHQSIIVLILIDMSYTCIYIFFFNIYHVYVPVCLCIQIVIQKHNITESKWYTSIHGSMKYFSFWSIRSVHYIFYLEIFQKYWYVFFFWKCSICCIFLLIIKMFYFLR